MTDSTTTFREVQARTRQIKALCGDVTTAAAAGDLDGSETALIAAREVHAEASQAAEHIGSSGRDYHLWQDAQFEIVDCERSIGNASADFAMLRRQRDLQAKIKADELRAREWEATCAAELDTLRDTFTAAAGAGDTVTLPIVLARRLSCVYLEHRSVLERLAAVERLRARTSFNPGTSVGLSAADVRLFALLL